MNAITRRVITECAVLDDEAVLCANSARLLSLLSPLFPLSIDRRLTYGSDGSNPNTAVIHDGAVTEHQAQALPLDTCLSIDARIVVRVVHKKSSRVEVEGSV